MNRRIPTLALAAALVVLGPVLGSVVAAAGSATAADDGARSRVAYTQIEGTGSTWSKVIVDQWRADVSSNGMQVTYSGTGSTQGRKDFANATTDFGISEIPYQGTDEYGNADTSNGREFAYLPIVAGGTAFTYQLKVGGKLVRNLRLSGDTLAKIFTNKISNWNDPAITKDNNGRSFPSLPITPVVRADGSGTTAQFTTWLDKEYSSTWKAFYPQGGLTSYYPKKGRTVAQAGSDQVMNTISGEAGNGMIGYVEYSYPRNKDYPVVKVLNKSGYFVEPTEYNVAVALTKAKINTDKSSQLYLTQILDGVYRNADPRAYPLSSYSYMIIPTGAKDTRMTTSKRQTLSDFMYYSLCQGQRDAGKYGYSPLPLNLVQAGFQQLARLKTADPNVDLTNRDVTKCDNPTFVAGDLKKNRLAQIAPQPAACDKTGAGPCTTDTGTGEPSTDDPAAPGTGGGSAPAAGGGGGAANPGPGNTAAPGAGGGATTGGGAAPDAPAAVDPETGLPVAGGGAGTTGTVTGSVDAAFASATELSADRDVDKSAFQWLTALLAVALVLLPGVYVVALRRRTAARR